MNARQQVLGREKLTEKVKNHVFVVGLLEVLQDTRRTAAAGEEIGWVAEQMAVSISLGGQLAMVDERYR